MRYDENGKLIDGRGLHLLTNPTSIAMRNKWKEGDHTGEKERGSKKGRKHVEKVIKKWLATSEKVLNPITKELQELTQEDLMTLAMIKQARQGSTNAFEALLDRAYGKPIQTSNVNVQPIIRARIMTEEDDAAQDDSEIIVSETKNQDDTNATTAQ